MKVLQYCLFILSITIFLGLAQSCGTRTSDDDAKIKLVINDTFMSYMALDTVKILQVENDLSLTGKVTFDESKVAKIYPFAGGRIESLKVQLGDYVQKGQVLAVVRSIEAADYTSQVASAQANLDIAQKNSETAKHFYADGLMSEKEYFNAQSELKKAQAEVEKLKQITELLGDETSQGYTIKAPQSGYIVEKNATENMEFQSENSNYLFTIANLNKVYIIANVYESDIAKIKMGYETHITTLSYPDKVFSGKIDKIYNVIDPETKVMKIRIILDNPNILLKPEMFANIDVIYAENYKMNAVPSSAVIFDRSTNFVMVYHSRDSIETRKVTVHKTFGNKTFISSGTQPGEVVVSRKALLIYDALND